MGEMIGILAVCAVMICAAAWLLNGSGRPKNPKEDEEQESILERME